ncbi:hypothetical protein [Natronococcus sp.]|uniref:hypothetical protein n=1 Tax=Natronococcus sp. TaxID=35747 RepID=UPI0025EE2B3E|nr:hypothetical protein [Natronococcus sp.]
MSESDDPGSDGERVVEREETYDHERHGEVEVTGIWKGIEEVDGTRDADENDVYIVRYSTEEDGKEVDELTDTLDEFLAALE